MQKYNSFSFLNNDEAKQILDMVHDREIDLDGVRYDEEAHQLILPLTVISDVSSKTSHKFGLLRFKHYPIYIGTLIVENLTSWKTFDPDKIRTCMINYINLNKSDFEIVGATSNFVKGVGDNINISLRVFTNEIDEVTKFNGFF